MSKWESSEAKQWLKQALLDAKHHYWNDSPGEVYDHNRSLFHLYKYENFRTNLRALKNKTTAERKIVEFDDVAVLRESTAFPRDTLTSQGNPYYDTSETKKVLAKMANDKSLGEYKHCPSALRNLHPVIQKEYPPDVFAKQVNKEKQKEREYAGWQHDRNRKGSKKQHARYEKDKTN